MVVHKFVVTHGTRIISKRCEEDSGQFGQVGFMNSLNVGLIVMHQGLLKVKNAKES